MKDIFGNKLKLGQEVVFMAAGGYRNAPSVLKKGSIVSINEKQIGIKNPVTNKTIYRAPEDIIGNLATTNLVGRSAADFFEGEDHNK